MRFSMRREWRRFITARGRVRVPVRKSLRRGIHMPAYAGARGRRRRIRARRRSGVVVAGAAAAADSFEPPICGIANLRRIVYPTVRSVGRACLARREVSAGAPRGLPAHRALAYDPALDERTVQETTRCLPIGCVLPPRRRRR
ncbi:hypothetical protein AQ883_17430 [Burkholderia pseudomallei]|uniref:hypothetical protein n=1 Tax=Burkholderia pseudomallei TaxID=28450 RepID=UPI0002D3C102|nr:hypothetical protein [Burkholderia pseudomallei]APY97738.1 hypothetical protein BGI49_01420 [Burkholderia pseudomallei]APZ11326.1 hypothetical protein BGI52_01420 [Burkholderia pseudomallei]ARK98367.1 hypothetical protein BOC43_29595 [Burkholderia pseudomallei]AUG21709.1 hypothetical protein CXQ84_14800 [Burkholderia pseudomallei]AYX27497.1 hypothetical protein EGY16_04425 [Burkholderia pseudomallei]